MPRPRIPERRAQLLAAARALALERGWPSTTVADITSRVDIGKGAFYLEFENKAAILDVLIADGMRALSRAVHRRVVAAHAVIDLPSIYEFAIDALLDDPLMRAFFLGDASVLGDHVQSVHDGRYRQRFDWLTEYVTALQEAGVIAARTDGQVLSQMLSVFTLGLLNAPGTIQVDSDEQLRRTVAMFADLVGKGLDTGRPVDPEASRRAQLVMLDRLQNQLDELRTTSPRNQTVEH